MGIPYNVGAYGLRITALSTKNEEATQTEFNFQFETGLSKTVGFFLGGEGLFNNATLEAMVQFLVWKSKDGMNGISPIKEFEFPLGKEATRKFRRRQCVHSLQAIKRNISCFGIFRNYSKRRKPYI